MNKFGDSPQEEDLVQLTSRFKLQVEFIVDADCPDEAEQKIKELIQEGVFALHENDRTIYDYDITDIEPAEIF